MYSADRLKPLCALAVLAVFFLVSWMSRNINITSLDEKSSLLDEKNSSLLDEKSSLLDEKNSSLLNEKSSLLDEKNSSLLDEKTNDKMVLVASGGSSTAGGGCVGSKDHYVKYLGELLGAETTWNGGHGSRNTLDAAFLFDSYLPSSHVDLIIWEFAINDGFHSVQTKKPNAGLSLLFSIQLFVQQVRLHPSKPKLFMLYIWDTPFHATHQTDADGNSWGRHSVYDVIAEYVRKTDVYAGEFSFAHWIHEHQDQLDTENGTITVASAAQKNWLADQHHPNCRGNKVMAEHIFQALENFRKGPVEYTGKEELTWPCGLQDPGATFLHSHVFSTLPQHRYVSWTCDQPHVEVMSIMPIDPSEMKLTSLGKSVEGRVDRKYKLTVPLCPSHVSFTVNAPEDFRAKALHWVGAGEPEFSFGEEMNTTRVNAKNWKRKCVLNEYHGGADAHFEVFDSPSRVATIHVCSNSTKTSISVLSLIS